MRILVSGGAGFIGSTVVDSFIGAGHRVTVVDNESTGNRKNVNPKAAYKKLDIRNKRAVAELFKKTKFDLVDHHAAQIDVRKSVEDPTMDAQINIIGLLNLLDLSVKHKVKKIIFSSSGGTIYGECHGPAKETDPETPLSPYGVAKLASEKYIKAYAGLFGITYTIFRYANVYGPRQDPRGEAGVISIFSSKLLEGERCKIYGNGRQTRDYVYVKDVARANVMALRKATNQVINIGTAVETSVNDLYKTMASIVGVKDKAVMAPYRAGEVQRSILSISNASRILGWKPLMPLKKGLAETIASLS